METIPIEKRLSKLLTKRLELNPMWDEITNYLILPNADGKIWLVGGTVSRILCEELYGIKMDGFDFDFTCEKLKKKIVTPKSWNVQYTKYDNPTFTKESISVDLWPISDKFKIKRKLFKTNYSIGFIYLENYVLLWEFLRSYLLCFF